MRALLAATAVLLCATPSWAFRPVCDFSGGDGAGNSVAAGGDFDGDGVTDFAVGAPCSFASGELRAGRVDVFSGADGSKLLTIKGEEEFERLGTAVSFIDDMNADGRDELIVGTMAADVSPGGAELNDGGKAEVYTITGEILITVLGQSSGANLGEAVAGLPDVSSDGVPDFVVGAGDDRVDGERKGRAYLVSGANGSFLDESDGVDRFDAWASIVGAAPDADGDQVADIIVASNQADGGGFNDGVVKVVSGADMSTVIAEVTGGREDGLGRSVAAGERGFYAGATSADPSNSSKAGEIVVFSWTGDTLLVASEPNPQPAANFGTAVAALGDVDGDGIEDFAGSAASGTVNGMGDAGRVHLISGGTGDALWTRTGTRPMERFGQSLATTPDFDGDGVNDLLIGRPGDAPKGRRGAGSATLVSGVDGSDILSFSGRRGHETRIFVAGWREGRVPHVRSFNHRGRRRLMRRDVFRSLRSGSLSIAVLDDVPDPRPGEMKVVVGTGHGAGDDAVTVWRANRRGRMVSSFRGFGDAYAGGVTVGVGNVVGDEEDELIVAQADSADGTVMLKIWQRFDTDPTGGITWFELGTLTAFASGDVNSSVFGDIPIDANGAVVAVGDVVDDPSGYDEIVVTPARGLPVVRVLDATGVKLAEWLAYVPNSSDGATVSIGDVDSDGTLEIVTAASSGLPWVKAFAPDGSPYVPSGDAGALSLFAFSPSFEGGTGATVADVDLDGRREIVAASGIGMSGEIRAFETNGAPVAGWTNFLAFGPASRLGLAVAATDRLLRR